MLGVAWLAIVLPGPLRAQTTPGVAESAEPPLLTGPPAPPNLRRHAACAALAASPWPGSTLERRALLQRLESAREQCIDHAGFLATLGGFWLEEGDPAQALLWLERALLLDTSQLGARADLALALAALGEPAALDELMREWRTRPDIPAPLWSRLKEAGLLVQAARTPPRQPGADGEHVRRWAALREVAVYAGYESNLDHSPSLTELTLTAPDGPLTLPLQTPLAPRPGAATTVELSGQVAVNPFASTVLQAGLQGSARSAPGNSNTDWHHLQMVVSASQRWGSWRAELQGSLAQIGGNLNEPFRLARVNLSLQSNGLGCMHRLALDVEDRSQSLTTLGNSRSSGFHWSTQCPVAFWPGWTAGVALRGNVDEPDNPNRVGGRQKQWGLGWRATGPLPGRGRLEVALRGSRSIDANGYTTLLENGARRVLEPTQLNLEYARPAEWAGRTGAELVMQVQVARQASNLPLFKYSSASVYTGLRWKW